MASGATDHLARLHEVTTAEPRHVIRAHGDVVHAVALASRRGIVATGADASMGTATHPVITAPQSVVEGDTTLVLDSENPSQIGPVTVSHLADSNGHVELIVQTAD